MNYQLLAVNSTKDNTLWIVKGLKQESWLDGRVNEDSVIFPDGLGNSEETAESIYSSLYDLYQTNDFLKDGDTIEFAGARINKWGSYSTEFGSFDVPAMRFVCSGVHVLKLA